MNKKLFGVLISLGILIALIIVCGAITITSHNKAINLEEQINESSSAIEVQEKRRIDLIYNLVDTVQAYDDHEQETLTLLTEARTKATEGSIEDARLAIDAVAEAYPELKSIENYQTLMNELSTTENLITEYRNNFNVQVRAYNKHIRTFPNRYLLEFIGYEKIDAEYLDYDEPEDAPSNLFGDS